MFAYNQGAVHQQRSNIRVVLPLFCHIKQSGSTAQAIISLMQQLIHLQQWLFIMCHHNPDDIHTSFQPLQKLISLISTPSTKVEELIIEIMSYSVWWLCVLHHTYCTLYGICSCSVVLMYNSLILPQYLSHTATGVMKIEVYTAVSETPYFCLMVQLCVCIFEYVCL